MINTDIAATANFKLITFLNFNLFYFLHHYIVKITLNLSLLRCMLFADYSHNFHPIVMKFGKHYFLV